MSAATKGKRGTVVDLGDGRYWESNGDHEYGWLIGADGKIYGYPLALWEARNWLTDTWPPPKDTP